MGKELNTSYSVIGKYERDEMTPSIDAAKKIAKILDTTVGYLLGEAKQDNLLKDPVMFKRIEEIESLPEEDKKNIFYTIDNLIKAAKLKNVAAL